MYTWLWSNLQTSLDKLTVFNADHCIILSCTISVRVLFERRKSTLTDLMQLRMIGVKNGQFIQRGLKVRLDEMGVGDRRFSIDHEIVSKERSTSVRNKLGKFRQVE